MQQLPSASKRRKTLPSSTATLFAILGLLVGGNAISAQAQERVRIRVENPLAVERGPEVVTVPWAEVREHLGGARTGQMQAHFEGPRGEDAVPVQVLDDDADGEPDALLLMARFAPGQARTFVVGRRASSPPGRPASYVHAFHDERRDDVAWENRRIAFRTYGQGLSALEDLVTSAIDVWLRRGLEKLITEAWYDEDHYHTDTGEGADFFSAGPTLGAGGTGLWHEGTLYRAPNFSDYRIVANGPLRAIVELEYEPWEAFEGLRVTEHKRITIDAGDYAFRSESTFRVVEGAEGAPPDSLTFATGLVDRAGAVASLHPAGRDGSERRVGAWRGLSVWSPVARGGGGHGDFGTAVLLPERKWDDVRAAGGHTLVLAEVATGQPVAHYVAAGWTATNAFARGVQAWWDYLSRFARGLQEPLRVSVRGVAEDVR